MKLMMSIMLLMVNHLKIKKKKPGKTPAQSPQQGSLEDNQQYHS